MIKGGLKGIDKTLKAAKALEKNIEANRTLAVQETTIKLHELAVKEVSKNQSGTAALRYGPKRNVTVSKPGDPPHTDTGRLRQSIQFNIKKDFGEVGSNLKYAAWLEFGTENMAPRPWLSTAIEILNKSYVAQIFEKWMDKALKESAK